MVIRHYLPLNQAPQPERILKIQGSGYYANASSTASTWWGISLILTSHGRVLATGNFKNGNVGIAGTANNYHLAFEEIGVPEFIVDMSTTGQTTLLVGESGKVYASGYNWTRCMGLSTLTNNAVFTTWTDITPYAGFKAERIETVLFRISTGTANTGATLCVGNNGQELWGCGYGLSLGVGVNTASLVWTKSPLTPASGERIIAAAPTNSSAKLIMLGSNGIPYLMCAGQGTYGDLGWGAVSTSKLLYERPTNSPTVYPQFDPYQMAQLTSINTTANRSASIVGPDGKILSSGSNSYGEILINTTATVGVFTETALASTTYAPQVARTFRGVHVLLANRLQTRFYGINYSQQAGFGPAGTTYATGVVTSPAMGEIESLWSTPGFETRLYWAVGVDHTVKACGGPAVLMGIGDSGSAIGTNNYPWTSVPLELAA